MKDVNGTREGTPLPGAPLPGKVGPLLKEDLPGCAELESLCFSSPWSEQSLEQILLTPPNRGWVCRGDDGAVLGYVGLIEVAGEGDVTDLAVRPEARRAGIGRALMERLLADAAEDGICEVLLEVRASNEAALSLYASLGFESIGRRRNFYVRPTEDAILMRRQTDPVGIGK